MYVSICFNVRNGHLNVSQSLSLCLCPAMWHFHGPRCRLHWRVFERLLARTCLSGMEACHMKVEAEKIHQQRFIKHCVLVFMRLKSIHGILKQLSHLKLATSKNPARANKYEQSKCTSFETFEKDRKKVVFCWYHEKSRRTRRSLDHFCRHASVDSGWFWGLASGGTLVASFEVHWKRKWESRLQECKSECFMVSWHFTTFHDIEWHSMPLNDISWDFMVYQDFWLFRYHNCNNNLDSAENSRRFKRFFGTYSMYVTAITQKSLLFAFEDLLHGPLEFFVLEHSIPIHIQHFEEVSGTFETILHQPIPRH